MNRRPGEGREPSPISPAITLLCGDAATVLRTLPAASADCVVTSPPYWRLRDYGTGTWNGGNPDCPHPEPTGPPAPAGAPRRCPRCGATWTDEQYGLEATPHAYVHHLREVFTQLHRVLTPTGTVWLNLGDSYSTNSDGYRCTRPGQYRQPRYRPVADVPHKNLIGMPWRVAFALQADGWNLRNAITWHKPNAAPFPVRDRLTCRYETLFLLAKRTDHFFTPDARPAPRRPQRSVGRNQDRMSPQRGRNLGDLWTIPVTPKPRSPHPAAFPIQIPLRCIAAGCPPHGTVLDPFSGTGTTGEAAARLNRAYTGIDLNPAFHRHALSRLPAGAETTPARPCGPRMARTE